MQKYKIVDPSGTITFYAKDDKVAYVATIMASFGELDAINVKSGQSLNTICTSLDEVEFKEKSKKILGMFPEEFVESNRQDIKDCYMSFDFDNKMYQILQHSKQLVDAMY